MLIMYRPTLISSMKLVQVPAVVAVDVGGAVDVGVAGVVADAVHVEIIVNVKKIVVNVKVVVVQIMIVVVVVVIRVLVTQNKKGTATRKSPRKRVNEQNNGCACAL